jgi:hypothetical protein
MNQRVNAAAAAVALVAVGLVAAPGGALSAPALNRIWVSGKGTDVAGCAAATAPCRTLQYAHDNLNTGGQIYVLDPSGFGPLVISKAISVINDGVGDVVIEAAVAGQTAIVVNAGANDAVNLRGLTIEGNGGSPVGIRFNSGRSLSVQNCVIRDVTQTGIAFTPNQGAALFVSGALIEDFVGAGGTGINVAPSAGTASAVLSRVDILRVGVTGVNAASGASVTLRDSTVAGNSVGVNMASGSTVVSYGINQIAGNGTDIVGGTIPELGAKGPPGPQGPQGVVGAAGPTGPTGATGATGMAGPAGSQGAIGPTGPQGAQGPQGPQGSAGAQGATGPAGIVSIQAAAGPGLGDIAGQPPPDPILPAPPGENWTFLTSTDNLPYLTVNGSQTVTVMATGGVVWGYNDGLSNVYFQYALCYKSNVGALIRFSNYQVESYGPPNGGGVGGPKPSYSYSWVDTPRAGSYYVGFCVNNIGTVTITAVGTNTTAIVTN